MYMFKGTSMKIVHIRTQILVLNHKLMDKNIVLGKCIYINLVTRMGEGRGLATRMSEGKGSAIRMSEIIHIFSYP